QEQLIAVLGKESTATKTPSKGLFVPDAQMVFCIDTRSEMIRRNVESKGNYETFGYAGFFGIAMDYTNLEDGITRKSCPPIVSSAYVVSESHQPKKAEALKTFTKKNDRFKFGEYFLKRMKNMLPSAFGYVEGSGIFYGISTLMRTLAPSYLYDVKAKNTTHFEHFCEPQLHLSNATYGELGISTAEKVAIVKSAFSLTGWKDFAPIVLFIGHGSHSANNPFGSSLDCGACAASPGRQNARMLAKLANLPEVRIQLAEDHNIIIPNSTLFIGAEHNTTTDEIVLFDAEVPESHKKQLAVVKTDLYKAQQTATRERLGASKNSISAAQHKANHWGETRPEWGLAKNASFIIAPRALTKHQNLAGRCFLHSYAWESDMEGTALEGILQGPMVVTQWINNHYYFSTVDNNTFGGGSKITHNITGKFGVLQGNGGDLKMGLPLQSVNQADKEMYHQPLRLSVVVQAPLDRVNHILARNEHLKTLLDNEWIYLLVMDPFKENRIVQYTTNLEWIAVAGQNKSPKPRHPKTEISIVDEVV
ncbi:MAG: putative inorganic carbon transporter subunit DabA, partial [Maribacter sp.]